MWEILDKTGGIVTASFLLLMAVIGLPWNLIILKNKLYRDPINIFVLNITILCILLILTFIPFLILTGVTGEFATGASDQERCNVCQGMLIGLVYLMNFIYTIFFITLDRFLFFVKPLKYDTIQNARRTLLVLIVTWIISIILGILPLLGFGEVTFVMEVLVCVAGFFANTAYNYLLLVVFIVPLFLALVLIFSMAFIIFKNIRAIYSVRKSVGNAEEWIANNREVFKQMKRKRRHKELQLTKVYGSILIVHITVWVLVTLVGLIETLTPVPPLTIPPAVYSICLILFSSQVVAYPFLNTVIHTDINKNVLLLPCSMFCKVKLAELRSPESNPSRSSAREAQQNSKPHELHSNPSNHIQDNSSRHKQDKSFFHEQDNSPHEQDSSPHEQDTSPHEQDSSPHEQDDSSPHEQDDYSPHEQDHSSPHEQDDSSPHEQDSSPHEQDSSPHKQDNSSPHEQDHSSPH